ncbi:unnamed protein product [Caenorhabditis nigoni]
MRGSRNFRSEWPRRELDAEKATKAATGAKLETIRAIEHHIQTIREAIEGGKDGDWDAMTIAHLKAKRLAEADGEWEKKARNAVAELVTEANLGAQGEITQLNPLVPVSKATALKLSNELDEMISNVKHVDSERIFVHDYNVDEVVQKEGNVHSTAVGKALAQLEGIEKALAGNLHMDIENRKSKQMWLATQNLKEIVVFDNRASCCMEERRAPLGDQMKTLLSCGGNTDEFVKTVDSAMAKTSKIRGEYTEEDLNTRFNKVCRIGRRVAYVHDGSGALGHLYSWLKASLTFKLPIGTNDTVTPSAENNFSLLTRAEALWKAGKKADAVRVLQMTDGATRRVASDFIQDARRHQEALLLSRLLLAHAALTSIRSTY